MKKFYQFLLRLGVVVDFDRVPSTFVVAFEVLGLKKGDAEIGAYCEWRQIDVIVSYNRDFLRGLSPGQMFDVMSPEEFCETADI